MHVSVGRRECNVVEIYSIRELSSIGIGPVSSAIWVCRSAFARFRARPLADLESFRQVGG